MRPLEVVVLHVLRDRSADISLAEDDHTVQALRFVESPMNSSRHASRQNPAKNRFFKTVSPRQR